MTCKTCQKEFPLDCLDLDNECYDCANNDPGYVLDTTIMTKELIVDMIGSLAAAKKVSKDKITSELTADYLYGQKKKKKVNDVEN